jgi:hypothetical protein
MSAIGKSPFRSGNRGLKKPGECTRKISLSLSQDTIQRLSVHAAHLGKQRGKVADEILRPHLTRHGRGRAAFIDEPDAAEGLDRPEIAGELDARARATPRSPYSSADFTRPSA